MFYGPGMQNVDLSLFKSFEIHEQWRVEFRAESFNAFNHAVFGTHSSITSSSIGSFGRITQHGNGPEGVPVRSELYF